MGRCLNADTHATGERAIGLAVNKSEYVTHDNLLVRGGTPLVERSGCIRRASSDRGLSGWFYKTVTAGFASRTAGALELLPAVKRRKPRIIARVKYIWRLCTSREGSRDPYMLAKTLIRTLALVAVFAFAAVGSAEASAYCPGEGDKPSEPSTYCPGEGDEPSEPST